MKTNITSSEFSKTNSDELDDREERWELRQKDDKDRRDFLISLRTGVFRRVRNRTFFFHKRRLEDSE